MGPIERAVRAATAGVPRHEPQGSGAFSGPYPPHWSDEDRFLWDATDGTVCQRVSALSFGRVPDETPSAKNKAFGRRVLAMIERTAWDDPDGLPAERDFSVDLAELAGLCEAIFGDSAMLGQRLVRLTLRMVATGEAAGPLSPQQPGVLHRDFAFVSDLPVRLLLNDQGRPHASDGPCCQWADGTALYAVHGMPVPAHLFEHPEALTAEAIEGQRHAELRRIMIERYGTGRFMRDSGARVADHDPHFGTLYRKELLGDEPIAMVAVRNATPEPDGRYRKFFLRVPPSTATARAAVAWTFGLDAGDYAPLVET